MVVQLIYDLKGQPVAYDQNEVHTAACVLKAFFGDLPESLLPESLFDEIVTLEGKFPEAIWIQIVYY